jgi:hypothetical protein
MNQGFPFPRDFARRRFMTDEKQRRLRVFSRFVDI